MDDGEEKNTDGDDSQGQSRSSVNFAAVGSGIMVFLFIFAGLARFVVSCFDFTIEKTCLVCVI